MKKIDINVEKLRALVQRGATHGECAIIFNCSTDTIFRYCKKHKITGYRTHKSKGTDTTKINRFGENSRGRKPKQSSLMQDDLKEIENEFNPGWDNDLWDGR